MRRIVILVALGMFLCPTTSANQGSGKPAKNRKPKPKPGSAQTSRVGPSKKPQSSPATKLTKTVKLTTHDLQVIFHELLPPRQQQQIAADPEERKKLVEDIKKLLAVAHAAEQENYAEHADLKTQLSFQLDMALNDAYKKKHPDAKTPDEEINAYYASHPKDFDDFLQGNPSAAQQARGSQRDVMKKQFGELRVVAERARTEGLDREDLTRLQMLLTRSQALAGAYITELRKNADKLVSAAEVNRYYQEHLADFDEVRVRHILISTHAEEEAADETDAADASNRKEKKPAERPHVLTKEGARKNAQELLDRVRKGEDFAKLAKENSDDPGSKDNGGEYDFFGRGKMVVEFEKAAFALKPGEVSDLVETQFGFHIIKVEARRTAPATDPKARRQITDKLIQGKLEALITEIAHKSPVVVPEDFDTRPTPRAQPPKPSTNREEM